MSPQESCFKVREGQVPALASPGSSADTDDFPDLGFLGIESHFSLHRSSSEDSDSP